MFSPQAVEWQPEIAGALLSEGGGHRAVAATAGGPADLDAAGERRDRLAGVQRLAGAGGGDDSLGHEHAAAAVRSVGEPVDNRAAMSARA